ncbi:MAG TPA: thermonuclease family protein [Vicinamibacterales bacterium]|nr:thermonuclease family protein [Vicinamibacterales bacterium]
MRRVTIHTLTIIALAVSMLSVAAAQRGAATTGRRDLVGKQFDARVSRVADGDTLDAIPTGESRPIRIRLEGVDAPEQGEVFAREALALLRTLVFDQRVRVRGRDVDRYGRLVARVLHGEADASVHLVRAGLACHAYAYDAALAREESQARRAGIGFWAAAAKKPACVTRTAFSARPRKGAQGMGSRISAISAAKRGSFRIGT